MQSSPFVLAFVSLLCLLLLAHAAPAVQPDRSEYNPMRQMMASNGYEVYEWAQPVFHKRGAAFYPARGKKSLSISEADRLADQYFDLPQF